MNSPCKRNGVDCPDRKVGCRATCAHGWDKYQKEIEARRDARYENNILADAIIGKREERLCRHRRTKPRGKC